MLGAPRLPSSAPATAATAEIIDTRHRRHEGVTRTMTDDQTIAPHGGTLVDLLVPDADRDKLADEAGHFPKLVVNERELSDLEMLAVGALSPLRGFQVEADYRSIL